MEHQLVIGQLLQERDYDNEHNSSEYKDDVVDRLCDVSGVQVYVIMPVSSLYVLVVQILKVVGDNECLVDQNQARNDN